MKAFKFVGIAILYFMVWFAAYLGLLSAVPKWGYLAPVWFVGTAALAQVVSALFFVFRYSVYRDVKGATDVVGVISGCLFLIAAVAFAFLSSAIFWIALYGE